MDRIVVIAELAYQSQMWRCVFSAYAGHFFGPFPKFTNGGAEAPSKSTAASQGQSASLRGPPIRTHLPVAGK